MVDFRNFLQNNSNTLLQTGIGLLGGQNAQQQAAMGLQGFAQGRQTNKTLEFLRQANPELAQGVESGAISPGDAYKLYYQQKLEAEKPQKPNLMGAGGAIYNADTGTWITPPQTAGGQEYGLNPQYGVDAQGNPVIIQLSKSGTSQKTALPEGVQLSKEPIKLDAGNMWVLLDPITRQPIGQIPKNLAEAEAQKEIGTAQGKAIAAAPADYQSGENALSLIESLRTDPNRERGTGMSSVFNAVPGTSGFDYQKKVDQATSGAFLSAIQQMRGMGQLSNAEGQTATAAVTRMNTASSEEEFIAALNDYEKIVRQGMARAASKMGGSVPAPQQADPLGIR